MELAFHASHLMIVGESSEGMSLQPCNEHTDRTTTCDDIQRRALGRKPRLCDTRDVEEALAIAVGVASVRASWRIVVVSMRTDELFDGSNLGCQRKLLENPQ